MYSSDVESELVTLERVLKGRIDTPPHHRPAPPALQKQDVPDAADDVADDRPLPLPDWAQRLPATNAMLNGLATLLLLVGFTAIKAGHVSLHRRMMLTAFGVSIGFLTLYLVHKAALHHFTGEYNTRFRGSGSVAAVYYVILASHVLLAMTVPVLASLTIWHGLRDNRIKHRRMAKVTFPIWLYVSVTGVIIYWMLYQLE
jgi:protein SCO1/2/putative membrane protein